MSETRKLAAVVRESGDVEESLASRPPALAHVAVRQPELRLQSASAAKSLLSASSEYALPASFASAVR
jgi:hypothetical protein